MAIYRRLRNKTRSMIKIKNVSDVITNSSSEVFVFKTKKSPSEVFEQLKEFTSGFCLPEIFNYKKFLEDKTYRSDWQELEIHWKDTSDPCNVLNELIEMFSYDWENYKDEPRFSSSYATYHKYFKKFKKECREKRLRNPNKEDIHQFLNKYSTDTLIEMWTSGEPRSIAKLDGRMIMFSEDENSIPIEDFERINNTFNGYNVHLG
jgi:hypothetical protein